MVLCALLAVAFGVLNLVSYALTATDKRRAREGRRRVPERVFWTLAMAGLWPGIAFAMARHRHKTRKAAFLAPFVVASCIGTLVLGFLAAWCLGVPLT